MRAVVGITGATGTIYGYRLLQKLKEHGIETAIVISDYATKILEMEDGKSVADLTEFGEVYSSSDLMAPTASGSYKFDAMVIVPCTMKTLAEIANGLSSNLISRTADVALKERRKLILVTRETPLSLVHIKNMLKATSAGAVVLPASPGFYHKPKTIEDLVDYVVGKVLDQLGIEHELFRRWGAEK
ncbi:MAG: UbiX family flavin prenyltransferase [Candidatus Methanosuratincola sp.]|jgi:4-hydroxy-3-polyprenylbenzoate decarboxylase|nr:UbiX family flavin prenyltransferase [Candidatus Methanosuratincola sp.]